MNFNTLKRPRNYILGLQHLIAMFGATVLVPILTGMSTTVALFSAGVGTLIFHLCTKGKVPVFLGSSFAFIPLIVEVSRTYQGDLRYVQGGIVVAGLLYIALSIIIFFVGDQKITQLFPPHVVGPMIIVIGCNLIPVAIGMSGLDAYQAGEASVHIPIIISSVTLLTAISINIFAKGFLKQLSILIGVIIGCLMAYGLHQLDVSLIQSTPSFQLPPFQMPIFSADAILVISPIVLAVFMEHVGDITTNGTVVGQDFIADPGLHRTLLGDGLATVFAGFIGGPANTTYGENTGVLAITKNYDPSILRLTAILAIIISMIGKLGAALSSIPVPVMGGISLMLFTMIAWIGVKNIKDNHVAWTIPNIIVMASILIIGLSKTYIPGFDPSVPIPGTQQSLSGLSLAAIVGILLNSVMMLFRKQDVHGGTNA